jgi:hypothetical protein
VNVPIPLTLSIARRSGVERCGKSETRLEIGSLSFEALRPPTLTQRTLSMDDGLFWMIVFCSLVAIFFFLYLSEHNSASSVRDFG